MKLKHLLVLSTTSVLASSLLSGCGMGSTAAGPSSYALGAMHGSLMGGPAPITNATVKIYATQSVASPSSSNNFGYGQPGLLLAEATSVDGTAGHDTDAQGGFSFSAANYVAACPAGQQVYVTASGGNSGAGTNNNILLMAALGSCASLYDTAATGKTYQGSTIWINEVTTVAAAYALGNFMTVSGTASPFTVNVSAPANNNACDGTVSSCVGTASFNSTTGVESGVANGLLHAFENAANLADNTTGVAKTTVTTGVSGATGTIPTAEINMFANAMQACVNSTGSNGASPCVTLFGATPSVAGTAPTNTLSAFMNLAKNPYPASTTMGTIFGLQTPQSAFYSPSLLAAPADAALAIVYSGGSLDTSGPTDVTIDANDQVYVSNKAASSIVSLASNGAFLSGTTGWTNTNLTNPQGIAADSLGNVFVANNKTGGAGTESGTFQFTNTGTYEALYQNTTPISFAYDVAVTKRNDVWTAYATYGVGDADWLRCTLVSGVCSYALVAGTQASVANGGFTLLASTAPYAVSVDQNQNVWLPQLGTGTGSIMSVLTNYYAASPATAPAYDNSTGAGTGTNAYKKISTAISACTNYPLTTVFDSTGTAWTAMEGNSVQGGLCKIVPTTNSTSNITAITPTTALTTPAGALPEGAAMDGDGSVWLSLYSANSGTALYTGAPAYANFGLASYNTTSGGAQLTQPANGFNGCSVVAGTTTCATAATASSTAAASPVPAVSNAYRLAIDSTGAIWTTNYAAGTVTQVIGTAAPAWPLLAMGTPGVRPY